MEFKSLSDFLSMGGYAYFVWSAYAVAIVSVLWMVSTNFRRHKALLSKLKQSKRSS